LKRTPRQTLFGSPLLFASSISGTSTFPAEESHILAANPSGVARLSTMQNGAETVAPVVDGQSKKMHSRVVRLKPKPKKTGGE
jgi:hypothetical protein